ncbi:MAG: hypothetical protein ACYCZ0_00095 [Minisyncoccota bacterium]
MEDYAALYTEMHQNAKLFAGASIKDHVSAIADLVERTGAKTLLDFGSGKGFQYLAMRVHEAWGGILPTCYDVGVRQLSTKPTGVFDGVIATDILEHIAEEDVDTILADIFGYATRFVFLVICCRPAKKLLPDGRNAHLCVKPPEWWDERISRHHRGEVIVKVAYDTVALAK